MMRQIAPVGGVVMAPALATTSESRAAVARISAGASRALGRTDEHPFTNVSVGTTTDESGSFGLRGGVNVTLGGES